MAGKGRPTVATGPSPYDIAIPRPSLAPIEVSYRGQDALIARSTFRPGTDPKRSTDGVR